MVHISVQTTAAAQEEAESVTSSDFELPEMTRIITNPIILTTAATTVKQTTITSSKITTEAYEEPEIVTPTDDPPFVPVTIGRLTRTIPRIETKNATDQPKMTSKLFDLEVSLSSGFGFSEFLETIKSLIFVGHFCIL